MDKFKRKNNIMNNSLVDIYTIKAINNQKSSTITILLFLFLGFFGAHRFYAQGVSLFNVGYLLTAGYLMIGVIVDFFLVWGMANKTNESNLSAAILKDRALANAWPKNINE